jgi:hypothetical protein
MLWVGAMLSPIGRAGRMPGVPYWHQGLVLLPDASEIAAASALATSFANGTTATELGTILAF